MLLEDVCYRRVCVINKERHVDPTPTYHRRVGFLCDDSDSEDVVRAGIMGGCVIQDVLLEDVCH